MGFFDSLSSGFSSARDALGHGEGGFWSTEQGAGIGQGFSQLGMGLLSQRPGEHWTAAFGRGMGGFAQGRQMGSDRFRRNEMQDTRMGIAEERLDMERDTFAREAIAREERLAGDERMQELWISRLNDPNISEADRQHYNMLLELETGQAAQIQSQREMTRAAAESRGAGGYDPTKFDYELAQRDAALRGRQTDAIAAKEQTVTGQNKLHFQQYLADLWKTDPDQAFEITRKIGAIEGLTDRSVYEQRLRQEQGLGGPQVNPGAMAPGVVLP